jgi:phage shock protein PspC (stress-responsive transcriptional regulator)
MLMNRRLYRCRDNQRIAGVAAGVAEYFDLDPTAVRVLWFLSIFVGGLGILLYIGMAIIVPLEPIAAGPAGGMVASDPATGDSAEGEPAPGVVAETHAHRHASRGDGRWTTFFGLALVLFGSLALIDALIPAWEDASRYLAPAFVIGLGILLVASAIRRDPMET